MMTRASLLLSKSRTYLTPGCRLSSKTYRKVLKKFWSRSCWQTSLSIRRFRLEASQEVFLGDGKRNQNAEERCQVGSSQYHLAVAGGAKFKIHASNCFAPTCYREVVLTASKLSRCLFDQLRNHNRRRKCFTHRTLV